MINIIVFGNVPLASWVIGKLLQCPSVNLIGAVAESCELEQYKHHKSTLPPAFHYCKEFDVQLITFEKALDIASKSPVLGISVRYNKIFKESYFNVFKPGIINLHGGELPKYRGSNIANYVVLNNEDRIGGTIHFISKGIDEGDIVVRKTNSINPKEETASSVFDKTIKLLKLAFIELIDVIEKENQIPRVSQADFISNGELVNTYRSSELAVLREVKKEELGTEIFDRKVRAFYFPGHEPAFTKAENMKVLLIPEVKL